MSAFCVNGRVFFSLHSRGELPWLVDVVSLNEATPSV